MEVYGRCSCRDCLPAVDNECLHKTYFIHFFFFFAPTSPFVCTQTKDFRFFFSVLIFFIFFISQFRRRWRRKHVTRPIYRHTPVYSQQPLLRLSPHNFETRSIMRRKSRAVPRYGISTARRDVMMIDDANENYKIKPFKRDFLRSEQYVRTSRLVGPNACCKLAGFYYSAKRNRTLIGSRAWFVKNLS